MCRDVNDIHAYEYCHKVNLKYLTCLISKDTSKAPEILPTWMRPISSTEIKIDLGAKDKLHLLLSCVLMPCSVMFGLSCIECLLSSQCGGW